MKITRRQLRKMIAEATFYRHKPRDPEDVLSDPDRFDHSRDMGGFLEDYRRQISSAIARRLSAEGKRRGVMQADLKRMSLELMREISSESGEYTGLALDDFLALIMKGDLDGKIDSMRK